MPEATHENPNLPSARPTGSENRATKCPQCGASVVQCRYTGDYCEDCGWPDENRAVESDIPNDQAEARRGNPQCMSTETTTRLPASPPLSSSDLLGWLRGKLADAEKTITAREQIGAAWRSGTDDSWKEVGCTLKKSERLKVAATQERIAEKYRREVQMFKAAIEALGHLNTEVSSGAKAEP